MIVKSEIDLECGLCDVTSTRSLTRVIEELLSMLEAPGLP